MTGGSRPDGGQPAEWDTEYLDLVRFDDPGYLDLLRDLLRRKFGQGHHPVDLVIPVFPPAITFYLTYGESILPGVPVVICGGVAGIGQNDQRNPPVAGTVMTPRYGENVQLILNLHPETRRIVMVAGSSNFDRQIETLGTVNLKTLPANVEITYLNDFSFQDLGRKIADLPRNAVIAYLEITRDNQGNQTLPQDGLALVLQAAKVPVYALVNTWLGEGIVGGYLFRLEEIARKTGELSARLLNGASPEKVSAVPVFPTPMFDWRQLQRWGISEGRLPPGSIVRFRRHTVWEDHGREIIGVILLLACQSLLIAALLIQRTRRRRAELEARQRRDELAHVSRVATVGELTSCLTHELNQPLTAIVTNAQAALRFLLREKPDFTEVEGALRDITKDGQRSGEIMHRLRNLLKKSEINQAPVDLNAVALEMAALVQAEFTAAGVSLTHDLAGDLPCVMGDRIQLEQVVLNLLANGLEATKDLTGKARTVQVATRKEDDGGAGLTVRDSGPGLSPASLDHLFEPFFTTKTGGMGMGLAISKSIVEAHGGCIWAELNQDRGAAFHLSLPVAEGPAP